MRRLTLPLGVLILGIVLATKCAAADFMIQADVASQGSTQHVEGRPIFMSKNQVQMILRDGQFFEFAPAEAHNVRRSSEHFAPYSAGELRTRLVNEFGPSFDVTGTGHYLVVHPRGEQDRWAARFENLYRSFVHYFMIRGLKVKEPEYPLVAVVWRNQQQYFDYAKRHNVPITPQTIGYYSPTTNRVHLFDATGGQIYGGAGAGARNAAANWQQNADTIIHEVTHQTAFNTGVHTRFTGCPRWLAEGLGTLFEARGINSSREYPNKADRINRGRLSDFKRLTGQGVDAGTLAELVAGDRLFNQDPAKAYAVSWAFTFFLVETQPRQYADYLTLTAARKPGTPYPEAARLADFGKQFGENFALHAARFKQFMAELR
ncbi:MAG: DUF1570 domain-containing protein [Planctomycetia bacterium]|nr:DUF1570 domain-containing protein [Planctomycetia bacterium]